VLPLATVLLSKDVALAEGALGFALLIGLQFVVTWSSVRAPWVRQWVTGEPLILLYRSPPRGRGRPSEPRWCPVPAAEQRVRRLDPPGR